MTYILVITRRAKQDRDRAFEWYRANFSHEFAGHWYNGIALAIGSLQISPMQCHKAHENDQFPFDLYELLYGSRRNKHRILFRVEGNRVVILHIRHSAQVDLLEGDL
jgi:plasmid stabilization system protein ParE